MIERITPRELGDSTRNQAPWRRIALLGIILAVLAVWQVYEHRRVTEWAKTDLRNRTRDITNSLGVILRSQGRFGMIPQGRLEAALEDMVESDEVLGIAVLNQEGIATARAGRLDDPESALLRTQGERWDKETVTFVNLVDLGMTWTGDDSEPVNPVILPSEEGDNPEGGRRERGGWRGFRGPPDFGSRPDGPPPELLNPEQLDRLKALGDGHPLSKEEVDEILAMFPADFLNEETRAAVRERMEGAPLGEDSVRDAIRAAFRANRGGSPRPPEGGPLFRRPPWISVEHWDELRRTHSAHWFVLTLSSRIYREQISQDRWLRSLILLAGLLATVSIGMAWRAIERSSQLRLRLLRATDMNAHLHEMNVAAAGLVHETKNPLNVVRGLAQMLANNESASGAIRSNALQITEEVDRVAGRLNQFIDYSRPLEVKLAPVDLNELCAGICRILEGDCNERRIAMSITGPAVSVEADGALLRQVIFNLVLNALQAVGDEGRIEIRLFEDTRQSAGFEVRDSGPGVSEDIRDEIFRPYFTASGSGSGLGLAIVRQIVFAHQWDITCAGAPEGGACFRVTGLRTELKE